MKFDQFSGVSGWLNTLGLSEKESRTYLQALMLGPTTIQKLSRAAEIERTSLYYIIDALKRKGLIGIVYRGSKRLVVAESPERLATLLSEALENFKNTLPNLLAVFSQNSQPESLKIIEGQAAILSAYDDFLKNAKSGDDYLVLSNQNEWFHTAPKHFEEFMAKRAKKRLKIRCLLVDAPLSRKHLATQSKYKMSVKILPQETKFSANIVIIPEHVLIHQLRPPMTLILLSNRYIARTLREVFEIVWRAIP